METNSIHKNSMAEQIEHLPEELAKSLKGSLNHDSVVFYNTSSDEFYGKILSPLLVSEMKIPVPGHYGYHARSVESIWQGTKVVSGKTDFDLFDAERPHERGFEPYSKTKFLFKGKNIDVDSAIKKIYAPAYKFMVDHIVAPEFIENIFRTMRGGVKQVFYDTDNAAITWDRSNTYSHSAILVDVLQEKARRKNQDLLINFAHILREKAASGTDRIDDALFFYFQDKLLLPSTIEFGVKLYDIVNKNDEEAEEKMGIFISLLEHYAQRMGYSFEEAMASKKLNRLFTDQKVKGKDIRTLLAKTIGYHDK